MVFHSKRPGGEGGEEQLLVTAGHQVPVVLEDPQVLEEGAQLLEAAPVAMEGGTSQVTVTVNGSIELVRRR